MEFTVIVGNTRVVMNRFRISRGLTGILLIGLTACSGTGTSSEPGGAVSPSRVTSTRQHLGATTPRSQPTPRDENPGTDSPSPSPPKKTTATDGGGEEGRHQQTGWGPTEREWRAAQRAAAGMSNRALAGQVIVARYTGTAAPRAFVARYHLGGVIVMADNVASVEAVTQSNAELQRGRDRSWPLVLAVDQEGGTVARLEAPMTDFPTFMSQGAAGREALARRVAAASGQELRAAGFTMVFAPDADVTIGPTDPTIGSRSAGDDAQHVAGLVSAATAGYVSAGIVPVIKHFPGHGSVTSNSHETLPVQSATLDRLRRRDFVPFQTAIASGAPAVMVGHLALEQVDPGVPADLSGEDVDLLSSEFGFGGLVVTDALEMAAVTDSYSADNAAVTALNAGVDLILMPKDTAAAYRGILQALHDGSLSRSRLEDAAAKIIALMMHQGARRPVSSEVIGSHETLSRRLSTAAAAVVLGPCRGPYVGPTVTPVGDPIDVGRFTEAARRAGLTIGGGDTVALLGYGVQAQSADVVVSLDTPYVLGSSTASTAKIALFGSGPAAMRALAAVLTGATVAHGRLPVAVSGVDPPNC
ncbi:MAG: beta-N-acetylhexosaminidase [Propionibacteriales bacterium]|nr:beta-N-acetylhexosaminidase [Propionibacteriales bacterium]